MRRSCCSEVRSAFSALHTPLLRLRRVISLHQTKKKMTSGTGQGKEEVTLQLNSSTDRKVLEELKLDQQRGQREKQQMRLKYCMWSAFCTDRC